MIEICILSRTNINTINYLNKPYTYTSFLQRFGLHSFVLNVSLEINRATCGSARVESDAKYEACNKCNVVTKP